MANKPYVVVEWNDTETDAKGWMCAYNFVGHYCGGGTRMHPTVTKEEVIRLATTMGYKYKACESLTTGGCKAGIAYDYKAPDALDVLKRFLTATAPYINAGVSIGGDLGVDYSDVFDAEYYLDTYADLKAAYGEDEEKALEEMIAIVQAGLGE